MQYGTLLRMSEAFKDLFLTLHLSKESQLLYMSCEPKITKSIFYIKQHTRVKHFTYGLCINILRLSPFTFECVYNYLKLNYILAVSLLYII